MSDEIIIENTICRSVIDLGTGIVSINLTMKTGESWTLLDSIDVHNAVRICGRVGRVKKIKFTHQVQI